MRVIVIALLCLTFLTRCAEDEGGVVLPNASKIVSATLGTRTRTDCNGTATPTFCTPDNMEGRVFAMGALLGPLGETAYNMTFFADSEGVITDPSDPSHPEGTLLFNLSTPVQVSGMISIPEADSMPADPVITRLETLFDYVDVTFTVTNSGASGTHTVRFVFRSTAEADDVDDTMQIGDKLLLVGSKFNWCTAAGCAHTTRPGSPLQQAGIIAVRQNSIDKNYPGNQNYAFYSMDIPEADQATVTYAQISDTTRVWEVDFDVSEALNISGDLGAVANVQDLVAAVSLGLSSTCEGCTSSDNRIGAKVEIGDAGSATR